MDSQRQRHTTAIGIGAVLLVFAIRLWGLNSTSLWYDETFIVYHAQHGPIQAALGLLKEDNALPLHGMLLAIWIRLAGDSEFSVRYLSVLLGVTGAPIILQLSRSLSHHRTTGLASVLAYATLPIFVYYSQEVRMYALAVPLTAGFALAGWRLVTKHRGPGIYVTLGLLMLATHLYTGLAWMAIGVWGTLNLMTVPRISAPRTERFKERWRHQRQWWLANASLGILAGPIIGWALWRVQTDASGVSSIPVDALRYVPVLFGVGQYLSEPWGVAFIIVAAVSILATLVGSPAARTQRSSLRRSAVSWYLTSLILPVIALYGLTMVKAKWSERYLLPSWGVAVVAAVGTGWELLMKQPHSDPSVLPRERVKNAARWGLGRWTGVALIVAWLCLTIPALARQAQGTWAVAIQDEWHPRPDFRGVAQYIDSHSSADDAIAVVGGYATTALSYYYRGEANLFGIPYGTHVLDTHQVVDLEDLEVLQRETGTRQRLWLVLWQQHLSDPTNLIQSALVESCRRLAVDACFTNVNVLLFDLSDCRPLDRLAEPPIALQVKFAAPIELEGYSFVRNGNTGEVDLWWRATGEPAETYTVFVHLIGADGAIIAQHDHIAGADEYPTDRWHPGTRLRDRFYLYVPAGGCNQCKLLVGLYTGERRLPLLDGGEAVTIPVDLPPEE